MPTVTLAQLEADIWAVNDGSSLEFPELQVRLVINEGLRRLNNLTGFNQNIVPIPGYTVAGQLVYQTPVGILIPLSVYVEERELNKEGSLQELAQRHRNWAVDNTLTQGPTQRWAAVGINKFVIHPMDGVGGRLLEVQGVVPIVPLVGQNDAISLDNEFADILVDYCSSRLFLKETGRAFANAMKIRPEMMRKLATMTIWESMVFPGLQDQKQLEPSRGRGA